MEANKMITLDHHQILEYLPQRYPFLMIDRVLEMEPGKRLLALKNVSTNEQFFVGHFPHRKVMPGVLMLEALAQAATILAYQPTTADDGAVWLFAGIDNVRFKRIVEPGDQLHLEVEVMRLKRDICKIKGTATVEGELACSAEILSIRGKVKS
jgi:3-hydroxyacyl-[acyl-carrier-protein] dehydratase